MEADRAPRFHIPTKVGKSILKIFFLCALVPILLLGTLSAAFLRSRMTSYYEDQAAAEGKRVSSILFDVTTAMYTSSEGLINTKACKSLFGSDYSGAADTGYYEEIDYALKTFRNNTAAVSSIYIYTDNPSVPTGEYIVGGCDYAEQDWYRDDADSSWNYWTFVSMARRWNSKTDELALVRRVAVVSQEYSAYFVLTLDYNYLRNRIEQSNYEVISSINGSEIFYATDRSLLGETMEVPADFAGGAYRHTGPLPHGGRQSLARIDFFTPYGTDDYFYVRVDDTAAYPAINRMTLLFVLLVLAALVIPSVIIFVFSRYFSRRVATLRRAMHQASTGDYNIIDQFQGDDELAETFRDLKTTAENIREQEARFYQAKIAEQELINRQQQMEFSMLASQIHPHFLYNTLEMIRMQALSKGDRDVAASIELLGQSMHYVLETTSTQLSPLSKELDYIRTYLAIMKLRFGDRFEAVFDIPEGLNPADYPILPLLLQPIVENALRHGLEDLADGGRIVISVRAGTSFLILTVTDNGCGMDEETLADLRFRIDHREPGVTESIGLYNINQRIHLLYGSAASMTIESAAGHGTVVTLTLPLRKGPLPENQGIRPESLRA